MNPQQLENFAAKPYMLTNAEVSDIWRRMDFLSNTNNRGECWKNFVLSNFRDIPENLPSGSISINDFTEIVNECFKRKYGKNMILAMKSTLIRIKFFGSRFHIWPESIYLQGNITLLSLDDGYLMSYFEFMALMAKPEFYFKNIFSRDSWLRHLAKIEISLKLCSMANLGPDWEIFSRLFQNLENPFPLMMIGSIGSGELVEESLRINGPEIARGEAVRMYQNDLNSMAVTQYRLNAHQRRQYTRYTGREIMSVSKKRTTNDHLFLAVCREQIRNTLDSRFPHNSDFMTVLHIGSTTQELKRWYSHTGHDFLFNFLEDKDVSRTYEDIVKLLGTKIIKQNLPTLLSRRGNDTRMKFQGLTDMFNLYETSGRKRIHTELPNRSYSCLMFEDCLYSMTVKEFADYWNKTGAITGYAVMFFPDKMFGKYTVDSTIYDYEEYIPKIVEIEQFIDDIWPSVLLLQPLFPLQTLVEGFRQMLYWMFSTGWDVTKDYLSSLVSDSYPVEMFLGTGFDVMKIGPIYRHLIKKLTPLIKRHLSRVRISWKGGFSNGYDHKLSTWEFWLKTRRVQISATEYVDSEIISAEGEIYLIKFNKSSALCPIVTSFGVPSHRVAVLVADLEKSYNIGTSQTFGLDNLQYFSVNSHDWFKLLNWALAEPMESLNFAVMMTTLNRIRGGLSLSSNVLVESMDVFDKDVSKIALACYMEVLNRQEVISAIDNDENLRKAYETQISSFLKTFCKTTLTIMSGGLAIPVAFLYKWLRSVKPTIEFVKYPTEPRPLTFPARKLSQEEKVNKETNLVAKTNLSIFKNSVLSLPHEELKTKRICDLCQLYHEGIFSSTGVPSDGQVFKCQNADKNGLHKVEFSSEEVTQMVTQTIAAEAFHNSVNAQNLVKTIKNFKHWLEVHENGIDYEFILRAIVGGPGTGKTEVVKALINYYEKRGQDCAVVVPFNDLMSDYKNTLVIGENERKTFNAKTTWYATGLTKVDYLIVDEMSAMDWNYIQSLAAFLSAKCVWLVGDSKQTVLIPGREGIDPTNKLSGINWDNVPTHELVRNFRLDAWRVKLLNKIFDYSMIPVRNDMLPPKFLSKTDYDRFKSENVIEREMVFSHSSAIEIFGCNSSPDREDGTNMSVRSCQGKTYKKGFVAVSCSELDSSTIDVHGMLNVAVSRSKLQTYFVFKDGCENDPVVNKVKRLLFLENDQTIKTIAEETLPEMKEMENKWEMSKEQEDFNNAVNEKIKKNEVFSDDLDSCVNVEGLEFPGMLTMEFVGYGDVNNSVKDLFEFYRTQFNFCMIDAIKSFDLKEDIDQDLVHILRGFYESDECMGRNIHSGITDFKFNTRILKTVQGKKLLPIKPFVELLERKGYYIEIFSNHKAIEKSVYHTKREFDHSTEPLFFNLTEHHIERRPVKEIRIYESENSKVVKFTMKETTPVPKHGYFLRMLRSVIDESSQDEFICFNKRTKTFYFNKTKIDPFNVNIYQDLDYEVGVKPTFSKVVLPELSRKHINLAMNYEPITSSWTENTKVEPPKGFISNTKLRAGTDAFRLAPFIDPSGAWIRSSALNEFGPVRGLIVKTNVKINWDGFIHSRTKSGVIKNFKPKFYRSIVPGTGNHYNNTPVESLVASQRIGRLEKKPKLTNESIIYAKQIARQTFTEVWRRDYIKNKEKLNYTVLTAIKAIKQRNYHGRFDAEIRKNFELNLTCSNKDQFKPIKNHKLDLMKGGQVLLQSPARINLQFIGWMRGQGFLFKDAMQPDYFTDDYETPAQFRLRMCQAIENLPKAVRVAIADGEQWDSQQNPVTLEIEKEMCRLFGAADDTIKQYFYVRGNLNFIMHGMFKGKTNGEKGSGFLDTKSGNTKLAVVFGNRIITGIGPKVVGTKGDDYTKLQTGLKINEHEVKKIKTLCGMKVNVSIGEGGEFCGNSISRKGIYPSITRTAMKVLAMKSKGIKEFQEKQISLRDKINEIMACGLVETIKNSAFAESVSENYVMACFEFINSMAHIDEKQWMKITKVSSNIKYHLNDARGPVLI